jgi:hypothetical protein
MSKVALRAPVLSVRLRPEPRPGRSGRAPRAGCRRCVRLDVAGSGRGGQLLASSQRISLAGVRHSAWLRTAVPIRCADDAGERSARCHRFGAKSSVAGAILRLPRGNDALDIPDESAGRPVSSLPMATSPRIEIAGPDMPAGDTWRASSVGQLVREVFDIPLSDVAGCFQDDAPVRRASRLRTTSGGVCCVYFHTPLTDRERSRQNFSSALRAPLTLRRFPGAFSFQQQPTGEESP